MATTEHAVLDRVRAVVAGLGFTEAAGVVDFKLTPAAMSNLAFAVTLSSWNAPRGGIGLYEEARCTLQIQTTRALNNDIDAARRLALQDARRILAGLVRDGHTSSGEYAVEDTARQIDTTVPKGASFLVMTLRAAVNFEALLEA